MLKILSVRLSGHVRTLRFLTVLFLGAGLLSSCAAFIVSPVSDADRDTNQTFDGHWRMTTAPLNSMQTVGKARFRCDFRKNVSMLRVKDGAAKITGRYPNHVTNVAANGRFRLEIPTENRFRNSRGNNEIKNRVVHIYQGILSEEESTGLFILGKESLNNAGCSTEMTIKKVR